jgi:hypothetical protein
MTSKPGRKTESTGYKPAAGVKWAVETGGIVIVSPGGNLLKLNQEESALWNLCAAGLSRKIIVDFFAAVKKVPAAKAAGFVSGLLQTWEKEGLLERA